MRQRGGGFLEEVDLPLVEEVDLETPEIGGEAEGGAGDQVGRSDRAAQRRRRAECRDGAVAVTGEQASVSEREPRLRSKVIGVSAGRENGEGLLGLHGGVFPREGIERCRRRPHRPSRRINVWPRRGRDQMVRDRRGIGREVHLRGGRGPVQLHLSRRGQCIESGLSEQVVHELPLAG